LKPRRVSPSRPLAIRAKAWRNQDHGRGTAKTDVSGQQPDRDGPGHVEPGPESERQRSLRGDSPGLLYPPADVDRDAGVRRRKAYLFLSLRGARKGGGASREAP